MSYSHAYFGKVGKSFAQIVGKALCCSSDGVYVHSVCSGSHNAAKAAGAEFEVFIERFDEFGLVVGVQHAAHFGLSFGIIAI